MNLLKEICENKEAIFSILRLSFHYPKIPKTKTKTKNYCINPKEYKALTGVISGESFGEDEFKRESVDSDAYGLRGVKSIALIHKVKRSYGSYRVFENPADKRYGRIFRRGSCFR